MFSIGIVGLPNVGKSLLFKTLTKKEVKVSNYPFCTIEPNKGIIEIPDKRLDLLFEKIKPEKKIPSIIEFTDIAGLVKGAHKGEGLGNQFLEEIRKVDAILHLVRNFEEKNMPLSSGKIDPLEDIKIINLELILSDLAFLEKIIPKIEKEAKRGSELFKKKLKILNFFKETLLKGEPISKVFLSKQEKELVKEYHFLTQKPQLIVLNIKFNQISLEDLKKIKEEIIKEFNKKESEVLTIDVLFENEILEFEEKERKEFLKEIKEKINSLDDLISSSFKILNLIVFYTFNEKEIRSWEIEKETPVIEAARKIHTDFYKNFIRAEVINWKDFLNYHSWNEAKEKGALNVVGRDYLLNDGEIIYIKV